MVGSIYGQIADKWPRLNTACCLENRRKKRGGKKKQIEREEKKKNCRCSKSGYEFEVKTRAADRKFWGAAANRKRHADEHCPRDEWNREIRSAFSKMRPKYRVSARLYLAPRISFSRSCAASTSAPSQDNAGRTMKWPWRFAFSGNPFSFRLIAIQSLLLSPAPFLSGESIYLPRLRFYFHAVSLIFPYSWREAPFDRYNGKTNRITSLFNVLRDHGWDSPSFATNEIETFFKTDSCMTRGLLLSILIQKGKVFGTINNIRWIVSILIKHLDTVYDRSQEKLRAIRLKASRWTHCKESI